MSKKELAQLKKLLAQIERTKQRIAKDRDTLRDQTEDLASLLDSCNEAIGGLEAGLRTIQDAVDRLSEQL